MNDPRPRRVLDEAPGRTADLRLALAWTDGLEGAAAKACSRGGRGSVEEREAAPEHEDAAAGFFTHEARKRNPAIVASGSGLVLVEADGESRRAARGERHPAAAGDGQRALERGLHRYYRPPAGKPPLKIQLDETGITCSADGYLIGAGALHESGWVYVYENGAEEIAELPVELYELLVSLGEETRTRSWSEYETGRPVPQGQRNDWLFHVALKLLREGKPRADVLERLLVVNAEQNHPPLERALVEKALAGAATHARKHPTPTENARTRARLLLDERRGTTRTARDEEALGAVPPVRRGPSVGTTALALARQGSRGRGDAGRRQTEAREEPARDLAGGAALAWTARGLRTTSSRRGRCSSRPKIRRIRSSRAV